MKQCIDKYLVQDRSVKPAILYETPQFMYILISMCLFANYPKETRLKYVKDYYDAISTFKISLPTPIIAGVRTPLRQFASCILFDMDDTLDSIVHTDCATGYYVSQRAGIGMNMGRIRGVGAQIRKGEVEHTGIIPLARKIESTVHSFTQNGLRGGAATINFPFFHWEIEDILQLKNNQGSEDSSVRDVDYCIGLSKIVYERYMKDETLTLFSNDDVPDLYENFGLDSFDEIYKTCERKRIRKKTISAREFVHTLLAERYETGRIYIFNADHVNSHSHTKLPIYMTNLCTEITLPTIPIKHIDDTEGRVATCILSAINVGNVSLNDMEKICDLTVRALEELIDYQKYPIKAAELYTKDQRTLGIGVINYAYGLAKNKISNWESQEAYNFTHELFENLQYHLLKASNEIAKEKGVCTGYNSSVYSEGTLPIDTYKKSIDAVVPNELSLDWESLRKDIKEFGLRHNALTAQMPSESSSVTSNATNGIEPPRDFLSIKNSKKGSLKMIVPEYSRLKNFYSLLWNMPSRVGYLNNVAIMQKFMDQSLSANTSYNPLQFKEDTVDMNTLVSDLFLAYKNGIKTLYYNQTYDMNNNDQDDIDNQQKAGCESGACAI